LIILSGRTGACSRSGGFMEAMTTPVRNSTQGGVVVVAGGIARRRVTRCEPTCALIEPGANYYPVPATLLFSALNAELATGSKPAFHVLGAIGARSPHDVVVGISEGGNDDFAFGGIGIAAS